MVHDLLVPALIAIACGGGVGFTLGAIGGGGSVVATPMLLYWVGLSPHAAIGTGALAVSASAFVNFAAHARAGHVRWVPAAMFAATGVVGAVLGSSIGKALDGQHLIVWFAAMMIVIGGLMLRPHREYDGVCAPMTLLILTKVAVVGVGVGFMAGFVGVGGGVLIVPGLILATGMPMISAIGTSLLAVAAFGLATALNYAASGMVDWPVAGEFIAGSLVGGWLGMRTAGRLCHQRNTLNRAFAGLVFVVAGYIFWRALRAG